MLSGGYQYRGRLVISLFVFVFLLLLVSSLPVSVLPRCHGANHLANSLRLGINPGQTLQHTLTIKDNMFINLTVCLLKKTKETTYDSTPHTMSSIFLT